MTFSAAQTAAILNPAGLACLDNPSYKYAPHIKMLASKLIDVAAGRIDRLMVTMPPQHGKSEITSKYFPAWFLGNFPTKKIILASYEAGFASLWGGRARDVLNKHAGVFGNTIRGGKDAAASQWFMDKGGYMITAGAGGPITGYGADVFIIDDPVKNQEEALSPTIQEKQFDWYQSTVKTRLQPGGAIILLMTRWSEKDLAGQILKSEGKEWTVINLPAICDTEDDPMGRKIGDALFPARYSSEELSRRKASTPAHWWEAMYQGRPSPREGGMFKRSWFKYYKQLPEVLRWVWSWDTAITEKETSDFTAGQLWAECANGYYLVRQIYARMEFPELLRAMSAAYNSKRSNAFVIENKASGQQAIQSLMRETKIPIILMTPDKDKSVRANSIIGHVESGRVFLPEDADFVSGFVEECAAFPKGAHDDQVDAFVYALKYMTERNDAIVTII
jgi:predicted phage terminase large subunit-like protein